MSLQVLLYSKSKRNGSSGVRHSLIHEVKTGFVCIWILRSAHLGYGDTFAFLSARNSSAAQLSSNQAFSFIIYRLRKKMLTFKTKAILQFPFYDKYVSWHFQFCYKIEVFIFFTNMGSLKTSMMHVNKPDIHELILHFGEKSLKRNCVGIRRTHFACTLNNVRLVESWFICIDSQFAHQYVMLE